MAEFTFQLVEYAESVLVPMTATFDVIGAVDWCSLDDVPGTYSYGSVWHQDRITESTHWEFRFTDPHTAFEFKLRWC